MAFKVLSPHRSHRFRLFILNRLFPAVPTRLRLDSAQGYSVEDQADVVESILRLAGLVGDFPATIVVVGHGSTTTNNPFRQAYGCGACGGNSGQPNARAYVNMAENPRVRDVLKARGLPIPPGVRFVAAFHDTCTDEVQLLDREDAPVVDPQVVGRLQSWFEAASLKNAQERCRFFDAFQGKDSAEKCLEHVRDRAYDFAQPRPEYGHSRVALAILGRRDLTRDLNLDRRSFLISYDCTTDSTDGRFLREAMVGAVPVCANISLDYLFSFVDNERFGAGTKLPLNVTSLIGVMTGSKSDLRIGLASQMVEIHEPMRIVVLVEASSASITTVLRGNARLARLVENEWIKLGRICPDSGSIEFPWQGEVT